MAETIEAEVVAPAKKKAGRPKGVKRSVKRLTQSELALAVLDSARGIPQHQIAKKFGVGEAAISMILDKFKPAFAELQNVEEYRKAKASLLDSASLTVLKEIVNPVKIEAGDVRALGTVYDILNKHSRLERGESTSNVTTQSVQVSIDIGEHYKPSER